jgi:nucleoside 2-deoxyribosyltransferase
MANYLKNKTTYLAGPISLDEECQAWRDWLTPILEKTFNIVVQDPCKTTIQGVGEVGADKIYFKTLIKNKEFQKVKTEFYKIIRKDLKQVDKSDFIIMYHDPKVPTVGTIHELVLATQKKSPVLILCQPENLEFLNPWILTLIKPQWLFTSWTDMIEYLHQINNGNIDSSHWW